MLISFSTIRIKILLFISLFTPLRSSALPLSADMFGILCGKWCFVIYGALTPLGGWCPQSLSRRSAAPPHSERSEGGVGPAPVEAHSKKDDRLRSKARFLLLSPVVSNWARDQRTDWADYITVHKVWILISHEPTETLRLRGASFETSSTLWQPVQAWWDSCQT